MAIQYINESKLCKCISFSKLYISPSSIKTVSPNTEFVGETFITDKKAILSNGMTLLRISEYANTDITGKWIPEEVCAGIPIEDQTDYSDDSDTISVSLLINGNKVIVYKDRDSTTPLSCGLKLGDIVYCDHKQLFNCNGIDETRYHIVSVSDGADASVAGSWILANFSVTDTGANNIISITVASQIN